MDWYVGTEWRLERKGLHKKVLSLNFTKLEKPHEVARVVVSIDNVTELNDRPSRLLDSLNMAKPQALQIGTAVTPIDYYVELFIRQMMLGETAQCSIRPQNGATITFNMELKEITANQAIHKLTVSEMYAVALRYKENGVATFKQHPTIAHDYFVRAAKCLMSFQPFENLTMKTDGIAGKDLKALLIHLQTNLAACLLQKKRYDHVIQMTSFVTSQSEPSEKSVYRRATAFYHLREYALAQEEIERVPNHQEKKDFVRLLQLIQAEWKTTMEEYKHVMQRMFT